MTTRRVAMRWREVNRPAPKPSDAIRQELPPARRETVMKSLELLQAEAARVELTRSERREVVRRINLLRNLLGWPAL